MSSNLKKVLVNFQVEGRSYHLLVRAVNDLGDSPDLVTEEPIVAKNPFDPPGLISKNILFKNKPKLNSSYQNYTN